MALKKNISSYSLPDILKSTLGLDQVAEMYLRIDKFSGEGNRCRFVIGYYNKLVFQIGDEICTELTKINIPEVTYHFEMVEDGSDGDYNVRKQAYEYLKTLPEFVGCEDC